MEKSKVPSHFTTRVLSVEELQSNRHEVVFAIKPKNLPWLEQKLAEVSNPFHENYGKFLTREEIALAMKNEEGVQRVRSYLQEIGASITQESAYGEFITAAAPLSLWANHFQVSFLHLQHPKRGDFFRAKGKKIISPTIEEHLIDVFYINDFPPEIYGSPTLGPIDPTPRPVGVPAYGTGSIIPSTLHKYYQIVTNLGNKNTSQAALITDDQVLSLDDLATFQADFKLPKQNLARSIGGGTIHGACADTLGIDCSEANLDFQYLMGIGQRIPTTSLNFPFNGWLPIIQNFTSWNSPPKVISISYGSYETEMSPGYIQVWNTAAMQLGVMGTTLVAASGDWGVVGPIGMEFGFCQYTTFFPASSPYVLSVGGTMGPEVGATEVTSSAGLGGIITSGGGFAFYSTAPDYQKTVVTNYLTRTTNLFVGYNPAGRGYPDVALAANNYITVIGGKQYSLSGTSASAPVMAGMIALINAQRALQRLPSMGFINPYFYQNADKMMRDVTSGNNSCTITGFACCPQGFPAAKGWDPTTGLGSVNFTAFYQLAVPQTSKSSNPTVSDPSGEAAGTFFFVLAFVILAALFGYSQTQQRQHHGRKESFVPLPERMDMEAGEDQPH